MGNKINQVAAAAVTAVAGAITAAGLAGADDSDFRGVQIHTQIPNVSQISLTDLASSEDSMLVNSIRQVGEEAGSNYRLLTQFYH